MKYGMEQRGSFTRETDGSVESNESVTGVDDRRARKKLPTWFRRAIWERAGTLMSYRLRLTSSCNISSLVVIARELA